jgi:hypothetical protein
MPRAIMGHWRIAAVALFLALAAAAPLSAQPAKPAPPDAASQREGLKLLRELFAKELSAARTPADKARLADKLYHAGIETRDDPTGRYVLLNKALDLAAEAADARTAMAAADAIAADWQVDELRLKSQSLAATAANLRDAAQRIEFVASASSVVDRAVAENRYDVARTVVTLATTAARASGDADAIKAVAAQSERMATLATAYESAAEAFTTLKSRPSDPDANLAVGKFHCFFRDDWKTGLPMLALGSDATLKDLAKNDLAAPAAPTERMAVADGWWAIADAQPALAKAIIRLHSATFYEKIGSSIGGLPGAKARARVGEAAAGSAIAHAGIADTPAGIHVINDTDAKEAGQIVSAITASHPDLLKDVPQIKLVGYHDGSKLRNNEGGLESVQGSYSEQPAVSAGGGISLWGVYEKWDAGKYLIVYRIQSLAPIDGKKVAFVDVCSNGTTVVGLNPDASDFSPSGWTCFPMLLDLDAEKVLEYRLWTRKHKLALDRVYIFRVGG